MMRIGLSQHKLADPFPQPHWQACDKLAPGPRTGPLRVLRLFDYGDVVPKPNSNNFKTREGPAHP